MKTSAAWMVLLALLLAPALAQARAGSGGSFGSRGARTFSAPPPTQTAPAPTPIERSITPNAPAYTPQPAPYAAPYAAPYSRPSPFASGLLGGFLGAGLFGLMFGHGMFGGLHGGGIIGLLIQIVLLVLLVRFLLRLFAQRGPAMGGGLGGLGPIFARKPVAQPPAGNPITLQPTDYQRFERVLQDVQAAWSSGDPERLRPFTTPEMLGVFAEQLADLASRGHRNTVSNVRLEKGDLAEAWTERGRDYATVAMRFSMNDVTSDMRGNVVDGSPNERVSATELWTFLRAEGGQWILSAIQQSR